MENDQNLPTPSNVGNSSSGGDNTLLMGVLSYLGPLVIVSYLTSKDNPFVKFHIGQGLVLFVAEAILWVASRMFWPFMMFISLLHLALFILSIIGIANVVNKKKTPLPIVGSLAKHFSI